MTAGPHRSPAADLDRTVGRLLTVGTYVAVLLLAIGAVLMFVYRLNPLAGGPPLDPGLIVDDITHLQPAGFIYLGLLALLATPVLRVVVSLGGFIARRERTMSIVAALILVVIALSIVLGRAES